MKARLDNLADAVAYVNGLTVGVPALPHPKLRVTKWEDGSLVVSGGFRTVVTYPAPEAAERLLKAVRLLRRGRP